MRATLVLTALGLVAIDEKGETICSEFRDNRAEKIRELLEGKPTEELISLLNMLKERDTLVVTCIDQRLADAVKAASTEIKIGAGEPMPELDASLLAVKCGWSVDIDDYFKNAREVALELLEDRIKTAVARRDLMIVQAVKLLDDLDKLINMLYSRLVDWYGQHFPELHQYVEGPEIYAKLIHRLGTRKNYSEERLKELLREELAGKVLEACERSLGAELNEVDEAKIRKLAGYIIEMTDFREEIQNYIKSLMEIEAPNLSAIAGPTLGARLISLAGGLETLAKAPASTIQVLGAEKALFRFFKTGRGAPKHGVIFQHPYVHSSPRWQRGKIARALATKISIAAKVDYFSREDRASELRKALEERIKEIKVNYASPPPRQAPKPTRGKKARKR